MSAAKLVPESKLQHRRNAEREQSKHRTELIDDEEFFQGYLLSQTPAASWSSRHTEVRVVPRPLAHLRFVRVLPPTWLAAFAIHSL